MWAHLVDMTALILLLLCAAAVGIWRGWLALRALLEPPQHELREVPELPETVEDCADADAGEVDEPGAPAIVRRTLRPAVVLAHGLAGFDTMGVGELRVKYFRRVAHRLEAEGFDVVTTRVPAVSALPVRAAALAAAVANLPHDRVTIIGHSMGGLDARWAISHGLAARVSDLITIGTPHRGTPLADILARGPVARTREWMARLSLPTDAIPWLTTWKLAELAPDMQDDAQVRYSSVVGMVRRLGVHPLLLAPHLYLSLVAGPNDGMVPVSSQRWGNVLLSERFDHLAQIGWASGWGGADAAGLISRSLERLKLLPAAAVAMSEPFGLLEAASDSPVDSVDHRE
jgi:triacylglycerol lipase